MMIYSLTNSMDLIQKQEELLNKSSTSTTPQNIKSSSKTIMKKWNRFANRQPHIRQAMKQITQQIKGQMQKVILQQIIPSPPMVYGTPMVDENQIPFKAVDTSEMDIQSFKESSRNPFEDHMVVKESCYRGLLKERRVDNDVESDEEDLNASIRYMYGELLYSLGSQLAEQQHSTKKQTLKQPYKQATQLKSKHPPSKTHIKHIQALVNEDDKENTNTLNDSETMNLQSVKKKLIFSNAKPNQSWHHPPNNGLKPQVLFPSARKVSHLF